MKHVRYCYDRPSARSRRETSSTVAPNLPKQSSNSNPLQLKRFGTAKAIRKSKRCRKYAMNKRVFPISPHKLCASCKRQRLEGYKRLHLTSPADPFQPHDTMRVMEQKKVHLKPPIITLPTIIVPAIRPRRPLRRSVHGAVPTSVTCDSTGMDGKNLP